MLIFNIFKHQLFLKDWCINTEHAQKSAIHFMKNLFLLSLHNLHWSTTFEKRCSTLINRHHLVQTVMGKDPLTQLLRKIKIFINEMLKF